MPRKPSRFRLEVLEAREVPAVLLQIDYSYDTGFFKNNADARAVMERVSDSGHVDAVRQAEEALAEIMRLEREQQREHASSA